MSLLKWKYGVSKRAKLFAIVFAVAFLVLLIILPLSFYKKRELTKEYMPLSFINFSDNKLIGSPSGKTVETIGQLLTKAKDNGELLQILHIGDSHIQADFFTAETRRLLSQWMNTQNTSRGFTFPYSMVKSNNPDDYDVIWEGEWTRNMWNSIESPLLGLAGVSASTVDSLSRFGLRLKQS
ncbi:MAG: hypothetical protein PHE03_04645, partial [Bacteroidales bacterium]|nr:hypothetical protein [Bacteroidales bacterium]